MLIVFTGASGCGKTTIQNVFRDRYGIPKIVTYTTRPLRDGERDGVDYHFLTYDVFRMMVGNDMFAEHADYRGWKYGTGLAECLEAEKKDRTAALTPAGWRELRRQGIPCVVVYLQVSRRKRLIAALERGDDIEEAYRRNLSDVGQFDGVEKEADVVINNMFFNKTPEDIAESLVKKLGLS